MISAIDNRDGGRVPVYGRDNLAGWNHESVLQTGAVVLMDKPRDWTSFDVVAKTRGIVRIRKIGHAGTLDPMATGLLVLCVGRATKLVEQLQSGEKEYIGTMRLGESTPSDDAESEVNERFPVDHVSAEAIRAAASGFVGESLQTPPAFSAIKVKGQRLYRRARRGEEVEAPPRVVTVFEFDITRIELPDVDFRITCSKGTYIRALARDLGRAVGSGAHLTALRRTRSGTFVVGDALTIDQLQHIRPHREAT